MKLHNLEPAFDLEVEKWLCEKIPELTPYQKEKIRDKEIVRWAPFEFYKRRDNKPAFFLWRLTLIVLPIYLILIFCFLPIKYLFTGKMYYGQKFFDNFHGVWMNKLKL